MFEVEVTLTVAGLHAGRGLGLAAVDLLFQYLQMLEAAGPQEWVWQESKLISDCKFRCGPARCTAACIPKTRIPPGSAVPQATVSGCRCLRSMRSDDPRSCCAEVSAAFHSMQP